LRTKLILHPVIFFAILFCFNCLFCQDIKNTKGSLYLTYEIFEPYFSTLNYSAKKKEAQNYLSKAKLEGNEVKIADGYFFLSEGHSHSKLGVTYADSIIQVSKMLNHYRYPALGYLQKGLQQYNMSSYSKALDNYIIAKEYALRTNNEFLQLRLEHCIASLKSVTNKNEEALIIYKRNLTFFDSKRNKEKYNLQYLKCLSGLANLYNRNKKVDSSVIMSKQGIRESIKTSKEFMYPVFLKSFSRSKIIKEEFDRSLIDTLGKAAQLLKEKKKSLVECYLMMSDVFKGNNDVNGAINYLKKVDSVYAKSPEVIFQAHRAYELLIKYYKVTDDLKSKSEFTDKLLAINDQAITKFRNLADELTTKYDASISSAERKNYLKKIELLSQQSEKLKAEQRKDNSKNSLIISVLIISVLMLLVYNFIKNRIYKKRFDKLLQEIENKKTKVELKTNSREKPKLDLPEDIVDSVLKKLSHFEDSQKYANNHYTLTSLAKELETNSAYLSKIINTHKNVNFSNYVNNLRIDLIIEKLTNDKVLRSYTIEAISKEAGFNNAQPFSVAFNKRTGIYPSYFIKKLKTQKTS